MVWRRGQSHPQALRDRVFMAADGGTPVCQIAQRLFVSISYVSKVLSRRRLCLVVGTALAFSAIMRALVMSQGPAHPAGLFLGSLHVRWTSQRAWRRCSTGVGKIESENTLSAT